VRLVLEAHQLACPSQLACCKCNMAAAACSVYAGCWRGSSRSAGGLRERHRPGGAYRAEDASDRPDVERRVVRAFREDHLRPTGCETTCDVRHTTMGRTTPCNMRHTTCDMRHTTCDIQHTYNMQHAACDIQHTYIMQHATCMRHGALIGSLRIDGG
jgi:hypothetical protein